MVRHGSRTSLRAVQRRGRLGVASSVVLELLREVLASAVFACGTCAPGRGLAASTGGTGGSPATGRPGFDPGVQGELRGVVDVGIEV